MLLANIVVCWYLLQEKAIVMEALDKNRERSEVNYALAAKLQHAVGERSHFPSILCTGGPSALICTTLPTGTAACFDLSLQLSTQINIDKGKKDSAFCMPFFPLHI